MMTYYIFFFGAVFFVCLIYFFLSLGLKAVMNENSNSKKSPLQKMNATVIDKFFDGEEIITGGSPTLLLNVYLNRKNHQLKHFVEQQMYMKYEIGDKIEVFVSQNDKVKIYPVEELR